MHHPIVSLITVVYNAEKSIYDTLKSAVSQTYPNIEIVIIDGGSTDNTLEKVTEFQKKISVIISEPDKGIYDAMNKGIKVAKGEWLYFLNSGDSFFDENVIEGIFSHLSPEPEGGIDNVDLIYAKVQTKNEPTGVDYITGEQVTFKDFFSRYPICHQATFTRKAAFEKIGYFDIQYRLAADTEWFARFFKLQPEKALFIDRVVAFYDIQGVTYHKRMKGYREYLNFGRTLFPFWISLKNYLLYPLLWIKVKMIRTFSDTEWFKKYRKIKFGNNSV